MHRGFSTVFVLRSLTRHSAFRSSLTHCFGLTCVRYRNQFCVLSRNYVFMTNWRRLNLTMKMELSKLVPKEAEKKICKEEETVELSKIISPPSQVKGIMELNYKLFCKEVQLPFVRAKIEFLNEITKALKPHFLKMPSFKPVQTDDKHKGCRVFLNPDLMSDELLEVVDRLKTANYLDVDESDKALHYVKHELTYDNFNYQAVLRAVLPEDADSVTGFSTIGHIIHLNLRDHALPYKHLIGQVLLDKIKGCRLVVNKLNIIDTQYRYFEMETLAADKSGEQPVTTVVSTTESDLKFKFDFAKVYWNPRLSAERTRIVNKLASQVDVIYDVFAGVGPFAIPAAKLRKCHVLANDLNPDSYRWLQENVSLNRIDHLIRCFNQDGRDFIQTTLKDDLVRHVEEFSGSDINRRYHVLMNLPDSAPQFLDAFDGLLGSVDHSTKEYRIPHLDVHCYCFVKNVPEAEESDYVLQLASNQLGHSLNRDCDVDEIFNVRKVAPNKNMYRISFRLHQDILYGLRPGKRDIPNGANLIDNQKRLKTD